MSRYWLDWFAEHVMENDNPSRIERGQKPYMTPVECFHDIVGHAVEILRGTSPLLLHSLDRNHLFLIDQMAPFSREAVDKTSFAIAVTDAPFGEIFGNDRDIEEQAREILAAHKSVYLDLADSVFLMPGGVLQVRALFIMGGDEPVQFSAILTRPGSNKGWLFAWQAGHHAQYSNIPSAEQVWTPEIKLIADASRPINRKKIDYSAFADLERLVWMSIVNWSTLKQHAAPAVMMEFDRHPANAIQGSNSVEAMAEDIAHVYRIGEMPKTDSIFDVVVLPTLGEERIRQIRSRVSGMKYQPRHRKNCTHMVDGFWRMQAYGPGRKLRKQVWINGFKRGHGSPKPVMNALPREYRAA